MVLVLILTQLLEQVADPKLEALADRVVDAIVHRFWHPEYRLMNEALDHGYQTARRPQRGLYLPRPRNRDAVDAAARGNAPQRSCAF